MNFKNSWIYTLCEIRLFGWTAAEIQIIVQICTSEAEGITRDNDTHVHVTHPKQHFGASVCHLIRRPN